MITISLDWTEFRSRYRDSPLSYAAASGNYYIFVFSQTLEVSCIVDQDSPEGNDFRNNYLPTATAILKEPVK